MTQWYQLRIENYLTIENEVIPLKPGPLGFVGKNAVGKTNILTALQDILSGKHDLQKIRDGADKSLIQLEIMEDESMVGCLTRRQTQAHSYLSSKGLPVDKSPASFLSEILDKHVINPVRLLSEDPVNYLKQHLPAKLEQADIKGNVSEVIQIHEGINGFEFAFECAKYYEQVRKETGRQSRQAKSVLDNMRSMLPEKPEYPPESPEDIEKLEADLYMMKGKVQEMQKWKEETISLIKEQEDEIVRIDKELEEAAARKKVLEDRLGDLPRVVSEATSILERDKNIELDQCQVMFNRKRADLEEQVTQLRHDFEKQMALLEEKSSSLREQEALKRDEIVKRFAKDATSWESKQATLNIEYTEQLKVASKEGMSILDRKRRCEAAIKKHEKDIQVVENDIPLNYDFDRDFQTIKYKKEQLNLIGQYKELVSKLKEKENELEVLEKKYAEEDELFKYYNYDLVKRLISRCNLPIKDVEFRDSELYVKDRHIDRLSTAERALVATELAIALAEQKGQIAICLDGIEYFDKEHRKAFIEAAEKAKVCVVYSRYAEREDVEKCENLVENGKIVKPEE